MLDRAVYPSWDHRSSHPMPVRSYCYHLPPMAVGSALVEGLTSYLIRLAEAHNVSPAILLIKELLPRVRERFRRYTYRAGRPESPFIYEAHTLNGAGLSAYDWATVLENVTGLRETRWLTMITWSRVISEQGLLRRHRAWCPHCFEEWRRADQQVYEPLLWSIKEVVACPVHTTVLEHQCRHCGREQHAISARSRPGHCCRCRNWLGKKYVAREISDETCTAVNAAYGIGELLSTAPRLAHPVSRESLSYNFRFCIDELADGCYSRLAAAIGASFDIVRDWFTPGRLIRLSLLLRICKLCSLSPVRFLSQQLTADDFDCEQARQVIAQKTAHLRTVRSLRKIRAVLEPIAKAGTGIPVHNLVSKLGYSSWHSLRRRDPELCDQISGKRRRRTGVPVTPRPRRTCPSDEEVKEALSRALLEPVPPRLKTITRQLGFCSDASLYVRFPELCSEFAKRIADFKRKQIDATQRPLIAAAIEETPPPTVKQLARRMGCTVAFLNYRFPEQCAKLIAKVPERKSVITEQQRAVLQLALSEDPAPSLCSIAKRVGLSVPRLRHLHPDLCAQVRKRCEELKRQLAADKRAAFQNEIRIAVIDLFHRGIQPSRRRVFAAILNPSMQSTKILDRQIADTLLELKMASEISSPISLGNNLGSPGWELSAGRAEVEP